jgi:[acyl-carrier-protein] S-malonyltransferase
VINNIDVTAQSEPEQIRDALCRQAAGPVHWAQIVRKMGDAGVTHLVEFGPGKVLARLTRRIDERIQALAVADAAGMREAIHLLKSR